MTSREEAQLASVSEQCLTTHMRFLKRVPSTTALPTLLPTLAPNPSVPLNPNPPSTLTLPPHHPPHPIPPLTQHRKESPMFYFSFFLLRGQASSTCFHDGAIAWKIDIQSACGSSGTARGSLTAILHSSSRTARQHSQRSKCKSCNDSL